MRVFLNPSFNRVWQIRFENNEPETCEAPDVLTALAWYLSGFDAEVFATLKDVEIDLGFANAQMFRAYIGEQMVTIQDVTADVQPTLEALGEQLTPAHTSHLMPEYLESRNASRPKKRGRPKNNPDQNLASGLRKIAKTKKAAKRRKRKTRK